MTYVGCPMKPSCMNPNGYVLTAKQAKFKLLETVRTREVLILVCFTAASKRTRCTR
jgi:hypothetical protein